MSVELAHVEVRKIDQLKSDVIECPHHKASILRYLALRREIAHSINKSSGTGNGKQRCHHAHRYLMCRNGINLQQQKAQAQHEEISREVIIGVHQGNAEHIYCTARHQQHGMKACKRRAEAHHKEQRCML